MKLDLPGFDFEKSCVNTVPNERLFEKVQNFLDTNTIDRNEYCIGKKPTGGFGELVIQEFEDFWVVSELRAGNSLVGIGSSSWPSKGSIVATMDQCFTVARKSPPAGVVWDGHHKMPHSWREDLSQEVGDVVYLLMT